MKICLAQIKPEKGDIPANSLSHIRWIKRAVTQQADLIVFPELSITGYEPKLAESLAMDAFDPRLSEFQNLSDQNDIVIGIGIPLKSNHGVLISMLVFYPNEAREIYSKQTLHADEKPYFISGSEQLVITIDNKKIAPAICYESLLKEHSQEAKKIGTEIYLASVAKSQTGVDKAYSHFPKIAAKYSMPILMVNSIGLCDNFESAGQSAIWDEEGRLLEQLGNHQEGLLVYETPIAII